MLTMFALLAQTVVLDADPAKAALSCAMSTAILDAGENPIRIASHVGHFFMQAAKADPGTKPFLDRVGELADGAQQGASSPEAAKALLPDCDKRFPLARTETVVRLPADAFQHDLMCFGTLQMLKGAASEIEEDGGDASALDAIESALAPISDRLTDTVLTAHRITSEVGFTTAMGDALKQSLALGNAESVAHACGLAPL